MQENVSQTRPKEYAGRGEEGEETSYNKNISFQELSERKRAYVKNAAQAFNKLTAMDYSRDAYYYCCDRKNPCNYIRMKSDTARDLNGEEYTKTEYCLYCDNKEVKNPDRPDGAFTDERVPGWNSGKWMELRDRMVELAGLSPDDLIMFYTEKGFQKYRQTYERDMERENRKQAKKR